MQNIFLILTSVVKLQQDKASAIFKLLAPLVRIDLNETGDKVSGKVCG